MIPFHHSGGRIKLYTAETEAKLTHGYWNAANGFLLWILASKWPTQKADTGHGDKNSASPQDHPVKCRKSVCSTDWFNITLKWDGSISTEKPAKPLRPNMFTTWSQTVQDQSSRNDQRLVGPPMTWLISRPGPFQQSHLHYRGASGAQQAAAETTVVPPPEGVEGLTAMGRDGGSSMGFWQKKLGFQLP